jgi:hypothetical protein
MTRGHSLRSETSSAFEIRRSQEKIDMWQRRLHARRGRFEPRIVRVRVHPDEEVGAPMDTAERIR